MALDPPSRQAGFGNDGREVRHRAAPKAGAAPRRTAPLLQPSLLRSPDRYRSRRFPAKPHPKGSAVAERGRGTSSALNTLEVRRPLPPIDVLGRCRAGRQCSETCQRPGEVPPYRRSISDSWPSFSLQFSHSSISASREGSCDLRRDAERWPTCKNLWPSVRRTARSPLRLRLPVLLLHPQLCFAVRTLSFTGAV